MSYLVRMLEDETKDLVGLGPTVHPQGTACDGGGLILGSKLIHRKRGAL